MDVDGRTQTNEQDKKACRRMWTKEEEETLLSTMDEIVANGGRADCGSFKAGTLKVIESCLTNILPNCGLKASPLIESKHHKQAKGWTDKPFPLYERLAYIFEKDCVMGKTTYTPENLAVDIEADDNFDNEFEIPGNFSPISVNQIDSNQPMHPTSSQPLSKKRSRSGDPIVRSMDRFANVMKDAIEKTNDTLDKFCQALARNKMTKNQVMQLICRKCNFFSRIKYV
ncbi:hypothetical protein LWI28_006194 [Acer negundo]|uniref:Myb/SANT-like domain-containing protein n=1 Tax=Acer negundo TaxID=4023 RepID=A0AAD5IHV1_ACENE|nr:hypothetical protein LWI28_006194 [Acer negundo]